MAQERRNLYRILHVQPEAPPEVVKAAYRALMTSMRTHPDLGGDHDQAARLNAAYTVLSDPGSRRAYDLSMRKPGRGQAAGHAAAATGAAIDPWSWRADSRCPFCHHAFAGKPSPDSRCTRCEGPLWPAPDTERAVGEILGRRHGERFERDIDAVLRLPGTKVTRPARVRDLSLNGISMLTAQRLPNGAPFHIKTATFDAVAVVVGSRAAGAAFTVHARLLTLHMQRAARGVYISAMA